MKNVAFLFGAGAEAKGNFELPSGNDFLHKTLFLKENDVNLFEALNQYFESRLIKIRSKTYNYSMHSFSEQSFYLSLLQNFFQKIVSNCETSVYSNKDEEKYFNQYKHEILSFLGEPSERKFDKNIATKNFRLLLHKDKKNINFSNSIEYQFIQDLFNENSESIFNFSSGSILDNHFHTIINPKQYGKDRFSRILNYYWSCYFAVIIPIFKNIFPEMYIKYSSETHFSYLEYLKNIEQITNLIYGEKSSEAVKNCNNNSYYNLINEKLKDSSEIKCSGVITSNYYKLVEIIDVPKNSIAYLNGKLDLFESPQYLKVDKVEKMDKKTIYFPFIFGQSFLKPLVSHHQINEFSKFSKILSQSDIIVVLGYNINEDDNHINSYLNQFLLDGKRVIYVTNEESKAKSVSEFLYTDSDVDFCLVNYFEDSNLQIINKIFDKIHTISISIGTSNAD